MKQHFYYFAMIFFKLSQYVKSITVNKSLASWLGLYKINMFIVHVVYFMYV